ncbi:MAG: ABC transporter permease [Actinomycetota bacterium]
MVTLIALAGVALVGGLLLQVTGFPPVAAYRDILVSSFGGSFAWARTLISSTPIIFTALAAAVAFRARIWNIGGDGQFIVGAIAASFVALSLGPSLPGSVVIVLALVGGVVGGALWASIAAFPRSYLGTDEVISTLMLNFVALYLMNYLIFGSLSFWRETVDATFPSGRAIPGSTELPQLWLRLHMGFLIAVACAVACWFLLRSSRWGFDLRVIGDSPVAARYAGINVTRRTLGVLVISGAFAGLGGAVEILGTTFALSPGSLSAGVGYVGIVVAAVAGLNPLAIVVVAILLAGFTNAGTSLQILGVPGQLVILLQGLALLFVAGAEFFRRYRLSLERPQIERDTPTATERAA